MLVSAESGRDVQFALILVLMVDCAAVPACPDPLMARSPFSPNSIGLNSRSCLYEEGHARSSPHWAKSGGSPVRCCFFSVPFVVAFVSRLVVSALGSLFLAPVRSRAACCLRGSFEDARFVVVRADCGSNVVVLPSSRTTELLTRRRQTGHGSFLPSTLAKHCAKPAQLSVVLQRHVAMSEEDVTSSSEESEDLPPLHAACQEKDVDEVRDLLASGTVDVNEPLDGNFTPVYIAACTNNEAVVRMLLEHKARPDEASEESGDNALTVCAQQGFTKIVAALLEAGADANATTKVGASATFIAAHQGNTQIVTQLVAARADVDKAKIDGATPAIISSSKGHAGALEVIINAKANLEAKLKKGAWSALRMACGFKHNECVRLLLAAGVEIDPKSQAYIDANPECKPASQREPDPADDDDPFSPASPQNRAITPDDDDDPFGSQQDDDGDDFWGDDGDDDFALDGGHVGDEDVDGQHVGGAHFQDHAESGDDGGVFRARGASDFGFGSADDFPAPEQHEQSDENVHALGDEPSGGVAHASDDGEPANEEQDPFGVTGDQFDVDEHDRQGTSDAGGRRPSAPPKPRSDSASVFGMGAAADGFVIEDQPYVLE